MDVKFHLEDFGNAVLPVITISQETPSGFFEHSFVLSNVDGDGWATLEDHSVDIYNVSPVGYQDHLDSVTRFFKDGDPKRNFNKVVEVSLDD